MISYLKKAKELAAQFSNYDLQHFLRFKNAQADRLAKLATSQIEDLDSHMRIETLNTHSTTELESVVSIDLEPSWMGLVLDYLTIGALLEDKSAICKVTR